MSMITYPLNNIEYTAEDAELFHVTRTSGVYANNSFDYSVNGVDNNIVIGSGVGWIKNGDFSGKVIAQKNTSVIDMGFADSIYPRIDAVVIRFNANENATNIVSKKGTAASYPIPPSVIRTESEYELHLYHVYRPAGAVSISASNITDLRLNREYCGIMSDSLTSVDTDAINRQISQLIQNLETEISEVEDGSFYWLKNDIIPISAGGTGANNAETARENIGAAPMYIYSKNDVEEGAPSPYPEGTLYFVYEE